MFRRFFIFYFYFLRVFASSLLSKSQRTPRQCPECLECLATLRAHCNWKVKDRGRRERSKRTRSSIISLRPQEKYLLFSAGPNMMPFAMNHARWNFFSPSISRPSRNLYIISFLRLPNELWWWDEHEREENWNFRALSTSNEFTISTRAMDHIFSILESYQDTLFVRCMKYTHSPR